MSGRHAGIQILDGEAEFRLHAKPAGGEQVQIRARLATHDIVAGDDRLEARPNSGKRQMLIGGTSRRRRDDGQGKFSLLQRIQ